MLSRYQCWFSRDAWFKTDRKKESGTPYRIRTCDPLIKSQLLYQLS